MIQWVKSEHEDLTIAPPFGIESKHVIISQSSKSLKIHFSVCVCVSVCVWICAVGAINLKKKMQKLRNRRPPTATSDKPDREHGNLPKPNRTRDDIGKTLGQCDRRRISENFPLLRGRFPSIPSIFGESEDRASRQETTSIEFYVT